MNRLALAAAAVAAALFFGSAAAQAASVAHPRAGRAVVLRAAPGRAAVGRLGARTKFGSPLTLAVVARRGRWLGVITPSLPNGRVGWVDARTVRLSRVSVHVVVSLSARELRLFRGPRLVSRFPVAVGAAGSPTPTGVFAITDKLSGAAYSDVYGCCILALSAHQPRVRPGWTGSDTRIAIHGGSGIGDAVSNGCLHASTGALRFLASRVPLGTLVRIRA